MIHNLCPGASPLNFRVLGGLSAPASPAEHTIWVETDREITAWAFSATEPESPAEGLVWFGIGVSASAPFPALKKNELRVYPTSCRQYVSGAWLGKTAKTWQGGSWVDWRQILYSADESMTWLTLGLRRHSGDDKLGAMVMTENNDDITFTQKEGGGTAIFYTKEKISLSAGAVIRFSGEIKTGVTANRIALCLWSAIGDYADDNLVAAYYAPTNAVTGYDQEAVLTVPSPGTFHVGGWITSTDNSYITMTGYVAE